MAPTLNTAHTAAGTTRVHGLQLEEVIKMRSTYRLAGPLGTPAEKVMYRVELDVHKLHAMARKAAGSKGGRAVDGPVVVTVVEG
jgi:hypothetical protein